MAELFPTIPCAHCGRECGESPRNPNLIEGFRDGDTGQHVCPECRSHHYQVKGAATYTEMPVTIHQLIHAK